MFIFYHTRWSSSFEQSEERIETTSNQSNFVTELLLTTVGLDTPRQDHAGLLDQRVAFVILLFLKLLLCKRRQDFQIAVN